jgi:glycosyltransferase 2 family protein
VGRVLDAIEAFWDYLAAIHLLPLALAIACQLLKVGCTSRAWRNVLVAAYPGVNVPWRSVYAAYLAGAGVNAIFPARAGDVVRLYLARRAIPGSTYTTLISSTLVLMIVDVVIGLSLFAWAFSQGILPGLDVLRSLPSFDFRWFLEHQDATQLIALALVAGVIALAVWLRLHIADLRAHVARAFIVLRHPARYLRTVATWQIADWCLRLATIWFFLDAFGIRQNLHNVLVVQATASLATVLPVSPGGIGTGQALLLYTLRGEATRTALLAFSVGMKITLTVVDLVVGFAAILIALRTLRFRSRIALDNP